jgi:hypothetical protein
MVRAYGCLTVKTPPIRRQQYVPPGMLQFQENTMNRVRYVFQTKYIMNLIKIFFDISPCAQRKPLGGAFQLSRVCHQPVTPGNQHSHL